MVSWTKVAEIVDIEAVASCGDRMCEPWHSSGRSCGCLDLKIFVIDLDSVMSGGFTLSLDSSVASSDDLIASSTLIRSDRPFAGSKGHSHSRCRAEPHSCPRADTVRGEHWDLLVPRTL